MSYNYSCKGGPVFFDATTLYKKDPNATQVRELTQCNDFFHFRRDPEVDCPEDSYFDFGCVDSVGRDLLCNEPINKMQMPDQTRLALEQSKFDKWNTISQEGCTVQRFADAEQFQMAKLRQEIAAQNNRKVKR